MIKKITDIFADKKRTYSFEFFSPKTAVGIEKLYDTVKELVRFSPDFLSVTYGAAGSTRETTTQIVDELQKRFGVSLLHHLTCIGHTKEELTDIILKIKELGVKNILALRGDPPQGAKEWKKIPGGFEYSYQLSRLIRSLAGDYFSIGVAGFPEGHISCPDKKLDTKYLKLKIDSGADFVITQLFFDNDVYFEYIQRLKKAGVRNRIIPGILPVTNYEKLVNFCSNCGAGILQEVHDIFQPIKDDEGATRKAGVEFAVKQCRALLDNGAPGLHFYTLNKVEPVREILKNIKI
jgi:methylenetetrahydrofolate reductase (NADPH)